MNYYSQNQTTTIKTETFAYIQVSEASHVLIITLNRPEKKNALTPKMIHELAYALSYAKIEKNIRAVLIKANGDVFCAGADLKAFAGAEEAHNSSIPDPGEEVLMGELFRKTHKPIVCKVEGNVFAGGFFFLTGSNYVVANEGVIFGLPEVKRGLFPFQVMANLITVIPERKALDWCIRGYNLEVKTAFEWGLVTHVETSETIDLTIEKLMDEITSNSPNAIRLGLEAYDKLKDLDKSEQHKYLNGMLKKAIQSHDAKEGIAAFTEKRKPVWTGN